MKKKELDTCNAWVAQLVWYKTLKTLIINIVIVGGDQRKLQVQPEGGWTVQDGVVDVARARNRGDDGAQMSSVAVLGPIQRGHAAQDATRRSKVSSAGKIL